MSLNDNTTKIASVLAKVNALPAQLDTSDADAAAADIIKGKTAYVNGAKVTGTRNKVPQITGDVTDKSIVQARVLIRSTLNKSAAADKGADIVLAMNTADLGNAADADVAKGKTYTSASGFKRTGTKEEAAPSGSINITENGTYDVTDKASAVVNVPQSGGGSPYLTDLGAVNFTESTGADNEGNTFVKISATFDMPEEFWTAYQTYYDSGAVANGTALQYFSANLMAFLGSTIYNNVQSLARLEILFADNGFGGYIYVGRDEPIYLTAMGDFNLSLTLTNQITFKTELEDDTIGSGKGKIEAIYFDGLYEDAAPTGLFTNSELILLHR